MVVDKTRASSSEQSAKRQMASGAHTQWTDAYRDLTAILEAVADIEQAAL